jgi:glutamate mutase epsilon subunit
LAEQITHDKLDWNELTEQRDAGSGELAHGQEVDLDEAVEFHRKMPLSLTSASA